MKKIITKKSHAGAIVATLAGITAVTIGGYYLYGHKNAEKNRAKVRGWMLKAKGEVLEEFEKAGNVTESIYAKTIDTVLAKYRQLKNIDPVELEEFINEMKGYWSGIKKTMQTKPRVPKIKIEVTKVKKTKKSKK